MLGMPKATKIHFGYYHSLEIKDKFEVEFSQNRKNPLSTQHSMTSARMTFYLGTKKKSNSLIFLKLLEPW
jgi:hypothetical protein